MIDVYRKLYGLLDSRERRRVVLVLLLLVLVAFAQVLGVASIMPFIAVLANPDVVETNRYLSLLYETLGFTSREGFLYFLGLVFFALLVGSLALEALGGWAQLRFSHNRNYQWSARLVGGYLRQPYEWFLNRHSADLATSVLAEVNQVVTAALFPAMQAIAHILVALFLLALLIAVDPVLAVAIGGVLGGGFGLIAMTLKKRLKKIGVERREANKSRFHIVQEAFGGIKDVKVAGLEESFVRRFRRPSQILASRQISAGLMSQMPSYAMQALLFGGMMLALLYLMASYGGFQEAIPVAALYAFAAYRLLPAIKNIYGDVTKLRFSEAALDALCKDFATLQTFADEKGPADSDRVPLRKSLQLDRVVYAYPGATRTALTGLSLAIPAFSTIGLVGSTGSGKTTTVDLILGLLRPQSGRLVIDGREITDELVRAWQRSVGYVPQHIFLADDSVAGNIAFGLQAKDIDRASVERAARVANLHDFVVSDLPEGYDTHVGERGVRLSGGQRQRIGIARALYHDPDILILDEATSALDNLTEQAVMEAVHNLGSRKTIVLIAHRLSTVKSCDRIYLLEQGRLVGEGSYDELIAVNERFRAMAEAV
jgi:ATP-binding cassette, subfamily B, bacterial PglK